jgi:hypothetical protein
LRVVRVGCLGAKPMVVATISEAQKLTTERSELLWN